MPPLTSLLLRRLPKLPLPPLKRTLTTHPPLLSSPNSHDSHDSHYDPPTGWLFGVPPGEKYQKEGWEDVWVYGFWGSTVFAVVAYAYKPDTS